MRTLWISILLFCSLQQGAAQFFGQAGYTISGMQLNGVNRAVFLYNFTRRDWLDKTLPFAGLMHGLRCSGGYDFEKTSFEMGFYLSWNTYHANGTPPATMQFSSRQLRVRHHYFFLGGGIYYLRRDKIRLGLKGTLDIGSTQIRSRTSDASETTPWVDCDDGLLFGLSIYAPIQIKVSKSFAVSIDPFIQIPTFDFGSIGTQETINQTYLDPGNNWPLNGGVQVNLKVYLTD